jgi:hypothetical protein
LVKPDMTVPSDIESIADFNAAKSLKRDGNLWEFATRTQLRMPWAQVTDLLTSFMKSKVNAATGSCSWLSGFSSFASDAKVACASISYGDWAHPALQPCKDAIAKQDWVTATAVYNRPGWDGGKNYGHMCLFADAAKIPHPPNPF